MTSRWPTWIKLLGVVAALGALLVALRAMGVSWSSLTPERVRVYILSFGSWAPAIYLALYAQPVVPLPISIMAMAAGLAFGAGWGCVLTMAAAMIRACGQFMLGRVCGRETMDRLLKGRLAAVHHHMTRRGISTVIAIRFLPNVPYDVQNVGLGCSPVAFPAFLVGTFVGILPWVVGFVYLGEVMTRLASPWVIVLVLVGLVAIGAVRSLTAASRSR